MGSPATRLVRALYEFGQRPTPVTSKQSKGLSDTEHEHDDLDAELEELSFGGVLARSLMHKEKDNGSVTLPPLENLSIASSSQPASKVKNLLRHTTHTIKVPSTGEERELTSWKMADWAYKRDPCPFPTRARGLFTEACKDSTVGKDKAHEYRIVARGYDKFFNVGEVSWTQWENIPKHAAPPFELTTKSNGCIILIAALSPSDILVTSKHSVGANESVSTTSGLSHAQMGERWLEKHLAGVGKSKDDLASELWDRQLTAVAELCDDSFEEHVLPYPSHLTGLHLHGLNSNTPTFNTLPSSSVTDFARSFGLIPTPYVIFPSLIGLRTYIQNVQEAGGVEGPKGEIIPVEGFVVRAQKRGGEKGEAFFWKVKYDEPYLMYREWRELTRKVLAAYPDEAVKGGKGKVKNPLSKLYLWWVQREVLRDYDSFSEWKHGKGIIKTREKFLSWYESSEGKNKAREMKIEDESASERDTEKKDFDRTLIVPVAVQGCGKTSLGLALTHLYGWGHTQSDDFLMKKSGPHFIKSVKELLAKNDVVFADKNNHIRKLRTDLLAAASSLSPTHTVRTVAFVWSIDTPSMPRDQLHSLFSSRIEARGSNHQTLRAGEGHEAVLWQFFGQYEAFDTSVDPDAQFDDVIEFDPRWSKIEMLQHAVRELSKVKVVLGLEEGQVPSTAKLQEAIDAADAYKPKVFKELSAKDRERLEEQRKPRYYGILIDLDLKQLLDQVLPPSEKGQGENSLWSTLEKSNRVEKSPHVTLVHEVQLDQPEHRETWDHYAAAIDAAKLNGSTSLNVQLVIGPRVAFDSRVMAIEVKSMSAASPDLLRLGEHSHAHITVGTRDTGIRPVEGMRLFESLAKGDQKSQSGGVITVIEMETREAKGVLKGLR